jgi:hypothetical protein
MPAFIQIAKYLAIETDGKGWNFPAIPRHGKSEALACVDQLVAGTDQAKRCNH